MQTFLATLAACDVSALAENTQSTNTVSTELDGLATAEITGVTQVNFGPSNCNGGHSKGRVALGLMCCSRNATMHKAGRTRSVSEAESSNQLESSGVHSSSLHSRRAHSTNRVTNRRRRRRWPIKVPRTR